MVVNDLKFCVSVDLLITERANKILLLAAIHASAPISPPLLILLPWNPLILVHLMILSSLSLMIRAMQRVNQRKAISLLMRVIPRVTKRTLSSQIVNWAIVRSPLPLYLKIFFFVIYVLWWFEWEFSWEWRKNWDFLIATLLPKPQSLVVSISLQTMSFSIKSFPPWLLRLFPAMCVCIPNDSIDEANHSNMQIVAYVEPIASISDDNEEAINFHVENGPQAPPAYRVECWYCENHPSICFCDRAEFVHFSPSDSVSLWWSVCLRLFL